MAQLELKNLVKIYPFVKVTSIFGREKALTMLEAQKQKPFTTNEGVLAVQGLSLSVQEGEFLVLLGASGCGKSTLLRMIAGLEEVSDGQVIMDGQEINDLPPEDRDMAYVFQNYSLYPHFTVYDNIAFPLRNIHMPREKLDATVRETARLLDLEKQLGKRPNQLSGGQLQRVAIGRAIVRKPKLFLMDEPFSNLDAPMRQALRMQVKRLHQQLGTTFIYVTHDQAEAFSLGTRIAVMRDGRLEQVGTPHQIYTRPVNRFVASFVGQPAMNFVENVALDNKGEWSVSLWGLRYSLPAAVCRRLTATHDGQKITVGIRPVNICLGRGPHSAIVEYAEPLGSETVVHLKTQQQRLIAVTPASSVPYQRGECISFELTPNRFYLFDADGSAPL